MAKSHALVTKDSLKSMLSHHDKRYVQAVIGRALIALAQRQTQDEIKSLRSCEHNGIGFSKVDSKVGVMVAKHYERFHRLSPWMVTNWMRPDKKGYPRLCKYHKQLDETAYEKAKGSLTKG